MDDLADISQTISVVAWVRAGIILIIGIGAAQLLSRVASRAVIGPMGAHTAATLRRIVLYGLSVVVLMWTLRELGFSLGVLLGAAGILSIALGFASQTSASNFVSGIFLVVEKSFTVGDVIRVGDTTGEVLSIDLLSVKMRTYDNLYVRVPNEMLIKGEITNISRFPIRRLDLQVSIAYKEDLGRVHELLISVADQFDLCLDEPRPLVIFQGFGESGIDLQLSVWASRDNYLSLRNQIPERVKQAFDAAEIEIPFPQRTIHAQASADPFRVVSVSENDARTR